MELDNKVLVLLLMVTIVVSGVGTLISLNKLGTIQSLQKESITGFAPSSSALVNFTINASAELLFTVSDIDFGTGTVNATSGNCTLTTGPTIAPERPGCIGFNENVSGLVLENVGAINISITLRSNVNSSNVTFINGGDQSFFKWSINNNESASCRTPTPLAYTEVSLLDMTICPELGWVAGADSMLINVSVMIDVDQINLIGGQRNATFIATGSPY